MNQIYCQYCGIPNNEDASFCRNCGRSFSQPPQSPVQPNSSPSMAPIAPRISPTPVYVPPSQNQQPLYPPQSVSTQGANIPLHPAPSPKKKKGKIILFGILIGIVGCCALIGLYYKLFLAPIANTAKDFLIALQDQKYSTAFYMMNTDLQAELENPEGLQSFIVNNGLVFTSFTTGNLKRIAGDPPQAVQEVELTLVEGSKRKLTLYLVVGRDDVWQIMGMEAPAAE